MKDSKIAILTGYDEKYKNIADITLPVNSEYAQRYSFDFFSFDKRLNNNRSTSWSKIPFIYKHLPNYIRNNEFCEKMVVE